MSKQSIVISYWLNFVGTSATNATNRVNGGIQQGQPVLHLQYPRHRTTKMLCRLDSIVQNQYAMYHDECDNGHGCENSDVGSDSNIGDGGNGNAGNVNGNGDSYDELDGDGSDNDGNGDHGEDDACDGNSNHRRQILG